MRSVSGDRVTPPPSTTPANATATRAARPVELTDLRRAADLLRRLANDLEPDHVPLPHTGAWWDTIEQIVRLGSALQTLFARRVEQAATWKQAGYRNAAEALAARAGTTITAARDLLETSRQTASQPALDTAVRAGTLSHAQTTAVAAGAAADPHATPTLLAAAAHTTLHQLRAQTLRIKAAADPDPAATHRRIHTQRHLHWHTDPQGTFHLHARGTIDDGARLTTTLEPIINHLFTTARRNHQPEPRPAYAFDALLIATTNHQPATPPNNNTPAADTGPDRPRRRRTQPRFLAILRADYTALTRGHTNPDETCEIAGLGPIPATTARQLLGEAILKLVITKGSAVHNVTHLGRGPTAAQRIALTWTSPTCQVPGCPHQHVEIDHTQPWAQTHTTRLD